MENEMADELLKKCRIDPTTTSIKLGMEQFADLAEGYNEQCIRHPGLFLYDYTNKQHNLESLSKEQYPLPPPVPVFDSPSEDDSEWSLRNFNL
ncbi:hypothetical protein B9Z55_001837 [Caenorhabditis nigoni]|nr:hypothetical protein B9Z55_001837 [Caenorhabditis nigoni]